MGWQDEKQAQYEDEQPAWRKYFRWKNLSPFVVAGAFILTQWLIERSAQLPLRTVLFNLSWPCLYMVFFLIDYAVRKHSPKPMTRRGVVFGIIAFGVLLLVPALLFYREAWAAVLFGAAPAA